MNLERSSEVSQIKRVFKLLQLLHEPKYSVISFAKMFNVGRQTIYRDLELLEELGYFVDKKNNKYFIFEATPKTTFTEEETALLHECIASISNNTPLKSSILKKLSASSYIAPQSDELKDKHLGTIVQKLQVAINSECSVKLINYHSLNTEEIKDRFVTPLKLSLDYSTLSAIETGKEKTYKVKRITDVEIQYDKKTGIRKAMNVDVFGCSSTESISIHLYLSKRAFQLFYEEYPSARVYLSKHKELNDFPYELKLDVQNYAGIGRWCLGLIGELKVIDDEGLRNYLNERLKIGGEF
ncbi:WYL domain-containing protein [Arcicella sp. LKC2W]|uniref:helix-turn-helix transcriptional regulator n=1 Tax=Arcicella sp. LKC2W TaxID=2984198 RepID=UPI002B1EC657|nr:WYL domain-containing protein [Arcicella sp. LKC2W]MEA5458740.1 WYL domain-containing protein [Arcicella sp. LKC2W]